MIAARPPLPHRVECSGTAAACSRDDKDGEARCSPVKRLVGAVIDAHHVYCSQY